MKILLVVTKAEIGGAQMSVLNLARGLKNSGNEITVAFGDGDFLPMELDKENIAYYKFKWLRRGHNPLANLFFIFEINNFLKKNNDIEAVHFNSSNSLTGAVGVKLANRKIKTIFTLRGMSFLDENYQKNIYLKFFYFLFFKTFLYFIDTPVFVSKRNLKYGQKIGLTNKGVLVYNGLDFKNLKFQERDLARKELEEKISIKLDDKYILGTIGRLCYAKNYEFLINNFKDILKIKPNAVLLIIGEGDERGKYEALINKNNLSDKIFLLGGLAGASKFIKGFNLFVLPSRYEGLSITAIEALSADVPALLSDVGGNGEVFTSDYELYELNNKDEFLEKFQRLQHEEVLKEVFEINNNQKEKFDIKNTIENYLNIYKAN